MKIFSLLGLSPGAGTSPPPGHSTNRSARPVTPTIIPGIPILAAARLFESASEFRRESLDDDEVLDCRIAEKIKTELKEYNKSSQRPEGGSNLSLARGDDGDDDYHAQKGDEDDEDGDEDLDERESGHLAPTEFDKALCLAAALKRQQNSPEVPLERPIKRKGRPPNKNKLLKPPLEMIGQRKRGPKPHDIRRAPEMISPAELRPKLEGDSGDSENDLSDDDEEQFHNNSENSMDSEKGVMRYECCFCDELHSPEECPIRRSSCWICDSIEKYRWMEENKDILDKIKPDPSLMDIKPEDDEIGDLLEEDNPDEELNDASSDEEESIKAEEANVQAQLLKRKEEEDRLPSYCDATIPEQFEVIKSEVMGNKVVTRTLIPKHMKLGPLVGQVIHVKDIPDDCTMKEIYEIHDGQKSYFISTANKNESNWLRYIRPAPTRDQRNVVVVWMGQTDGNLSEVYFVTCKDIADGCELFYWSDHLNSTWGRKKIDKMSKLI